MAESNSNLPRVTFDGHIVLIGPIGVGKTPIAEMIAERFGIAHVCLDSAEEYRHHVGWRQEEYFRLLSQFGGRAALEYNTRFSVPLIQLLMKIHTSAVFDCGGDDLVGWTREQRDQIKASLTALPYIAAILPFSAVSATRLHFAAPHPAHELNELLLSNPSYWNLANKVFYTNGCSLEPVARTVIDWIRASTTG